MVAASGEEDELSMTVSDLSIQGRRVSDRSMAGDYAGAIDTKLGPILQRMSWLEEQFTARTHGEESEVVSKEGLAQADKLGSCNVATAVVEATAAAKEAQSQLMWVTAEARNVERDFDHIISEARSMLDRELKQRLESEGSGGNTFYPPATSSTAECLSLRLEALEVHVNARLESLEDSVRKCCGALQNEIEKNAAYRVEEKLNIQTMINESLEVERTARCRLIDEERSRNEERQAALARALGEELEASIVAQAVAEVRKAACRAAREEARAEVERAAKAKEEMQTDFSQELAELQNKVLELQNRGSRWSNSMFSYLVESSEEAEFGGIEAVTPKQDSIGSRSDKGVEALEQFGVSVVQLESKINSLLKSSLEARDEQTQQHTNVNREMSKLRGDINKIASQDIVRVWEQIQKLQAVTFGKTESVSRPDHKDCHEHTLSRQCSHSPTPPAGLPHRILAMVPSPARSMNDRCGKSLGSTSLSGSLTARVTSPPPDPTPAQSPGHGGRLTSTSISVEGDAGSRRGAVSPGRHTARGKLVAPMPGPPRRPTVT